MAKNAGSSFIESQKNGGAKRHHFLMNKGLKPLARSKNQKGEAALRAASPFLCAIPNKMGFLESNP